jgi:hypothetical protein
MQTFFHTRTDRWRHPALGTNVNIILQDGIDFRRFLPTFMIKLILSFLVSGISCAAAATYHMDSVHGDDSMPGDAPEHAWKSLEKANSISFMPGDRLLFKAGGRWTGRLKPRRGGSPEALVSIGRYGEGPLPRIDGEGAVLDTLLLENLGFIEVEDLEITNQGPQPVPWRTGVRIHADGIGKMERVCLRRLFVHDVNGDMRKSHEGCGIFFEATGKNESYFDGLLIEKCRVECTDRNGICQRGLGKKRSTNVIIRGNQLDDIGGDGIKLWGTNDGLIEHNVVRGARARCNDKVSGTKGTTDGQGYDSDFWCHRNIFQYNYSFQNEGGFMLICTPGDAVNEDTIIRSNISVHDGVDSARVFQFGGGAERTQVYNNTIIIGAHQKVPLIAYNEWNGGVTKNTRFSNNLFLVEEGGRATYQFEPSKGNIFENNIFAGDHEGLPKGVSTSPAPKFSGVVNAPSPGFPSVKALSPAQGSRFPKGKIIPNNGGRDFFGNPVSQTQAPTIGAIEAR